MSQKGLGKTAFSAQVCYQAEKIVYELFPNIKSRIDIESFANGTLKLASSSSGVNQEVQFKKALLIKKINKKLRADMVKDLRFGIR